MSGRFIDSCQTWHFLSHRSSHFWLLAPAFSAPFDPNRPVCCYLKFTRYFSHTNMWAKYSSLLLISRCPNDKRCDGIMTLEQIVNRIIVGSTGVERKDAVLVGGIRHIAFELSPDLWELNYLSQCHLCHESQDEFFGLCRIRVLPMFGQPILKQDIFLEQGFICKPLMAR